MKITQRDTKDIIIDNFRKLRENTRWNIIILIWLDVIDIEEFIEYMVIEEHDKE